jgi:hypothetical protein
VYVYALGDSPVWNWQGFGGPKGWTKVWPGITSLPGGDQEAPVGIYTFKVAAHHHENMGCSDADKADIVSAASVSDFEWRTHGYKAKLKLQYTLSDVPWPLKVSAYKPNLTEATVYEPDGGDLPVLVGTREADVVFEVDPEVMGTYRLVITGQEADGSDNRNQQPKPILPKGGGADIWPPAVNWHNPDPNYARLFTVCCQYGAQEQGTLHQGAHYLATAHAAMPTAETAKQHLAQDGLISVCSHGAPGWVEIYGGTVIASDPMGMYSEPQHVVLSEHANEYRQVRFVLWLSCHSGVPSYEPPAPSMVHAAWAAGADSSLGFVGECGPGEQSAWWAHHFWNVALNTGCNVSDARGAAWDALCDQYGAPDPSLNEVNFNGGGVCLAPAGYGQW